VQCGEPRDDALNGTGCRTRRIAILQSNYLPWKGYFDLIRAVDEFILFDRVQYTKNDWRNRNQIKAAAGKRWLTVPVRHESSDQPINQVRIADPGVFRKHWDSFRQNYSRAAHFALAEAIVRPLLEEAARFEMLSQANAFLVQRLSDALGIDTRITRVEEYVLEGDRNGRLVSLCQQAGATEYLSGPAARGYIDERAFEDAGVRVLWADYSGYPEYAQPFPPFDHYVSVIDLIACTGAEASRYMKDVAT
jgi:hypothetical protein